MKRDFKSDFLPNFSEVRVLVIGDIMLDTYHYGSANRMSPEFPVPVVNLENTKYNLGGAANVAANIKSLGAKVEICSVIGNDENAEHIRSLFVEKKLNFTNVIRSDKRKTTVKHRIIGNNKQLLRIDDEDDSFLDNDDEEQLFEIIKSTIIDFFPQVVVLQDYNKGVLSEDLIGKISEIAIEKDIKICVDPKKKNFDKYDNVYIFKPNLKEFSDYLSVSKLDIHELLKYMNAFQTKHNISVFLLTMADKGVLISGKDGDNYHFPAFFRQIADVSGAGDTVISMASLLSAINADIDEIAYLSNLAGGLACEKSGVTTLNIEELNRELLKYKPSKQ